MYFADVKLTASVACMPRPVRAYQFLLIQISVATEQNHDTSHAYYCLCYLLAVRPIWHHAGLLILDCWTNCSRVSNYLHNGRQGLMLLLMQIITDCGQRAVLTVLEVCWGLCSRA